MSFDAFQSSGAPSTPAPETSAPAPETSSAPPAQETQVTSTQPPAQTETPPPGVDPAAVPPFTPNFKFRAADKEHEMPEIFRGLIKDPETQKTVQEIMEKAYGLESVKGRMKEFQEKYNRTHQELQPIQNGLNECRNFVAKDDYDSFFKFLNISSEKVLQWAVNKARYMELPPEQRQILDGKRAAEEKVYELEKQVNQTQSQFAETRTNALAGELRSELAKPDITAFQRVFDQRLGREGAFLDAVIEVGKATYFGSQGKVDLTAEQAIQKVISFSGGLPTQAPPSNVIPAPGVQGNQAPPAEAPAKKTTLPNLASKNTTAVSKPKFKNLDELRKYAQSMKS